MNADEIVRALRCVQEKHRNDRLQTFQTDVSAMARDAADMIESMQARLAESQRRERAAVEDLKISAYCRTCSKKCGLFEALSKRDNEGGCKDFEWRGPQEAGEGEIK